jgi:hypothetical protein
MCVGADTRRFNTLASNRNSSLRDILKLAVKLRISLLHILNLDVQWLTKRDILNPRCMLTVRM